MKSSIFDTYTSYLIPHGCHIHETGTDTAMEKIFPVCFFPYDQHALPHWKGVFRCCSKCNSIFISNKESKICETNTCPTIHFSIYRLVSYCTLNGIHTYKEENMYIMFHS